MDVNGSFRKLWGGGLRFRVWGGGGGLIFGVVIIRVLVFRVLY